MSRSLIHCRKATYCVSSFLGQYDYLKDEVARRLTDRLNDVSPTKKWTQSPLTAVSVCGELLTSASTIRFPIAVDLGSLSGHVRKALVDFTAKNKVRKIEMDIITCLTSPCYYHCHNVIIVMLSSNTRRIPTPSPSSSVSNAASFNIHFCYLFSIGNQRTASAWAVGGIASSWQWVSMLPEGGGEIYKLS